MNLADFDYPLPKELIAQAPLPERETSRLLVLDRKTGELKDLVFRDIVDFFQAGDALVLNDTKVFPGRLHAAKKGTGGKVDVLLLEPKETQDPSGKLVWRALLQPSLKDGQEILFTGTESAAVYRGRDTDAIPLLEFENVSSVQELIDRVGVMPLPPYIKREPSDTDRASYQTVYACRQGAVAAPTAGLHFTEGLLQKIKDKGVAVVPVTLHVGYGTFRPVEDLENHHMHSERFELSDEAAEKLNGIKRSGGKIWAAGTTSLRVLETCVQKKKIIPGKGETDLYIRPPFEFEATDRLITNFHLPKTTLLLLVAAFAGESLRKKAYDHAIAERYRFYSYGDAMVII